MAKAITQRISLEGTDELRRQFAELGRAVEQAFRQIGDQIARIGEIRLPTEQAKRNLDDLAVTGQRTFKEIENSAKKTDTSIPSVEENKKSFADLANVAKAAFGDITAAANVAQKQIENLSSGFSGLQKTLIGFGAVGSVFAFIANEARQAANAVNEISEAAEKSKTSINVYRQLDFMLQKMGLTAEEAKKALDGFGKSTIERDVTALTSTAARLVERISSAGLRFATSAQGMDQFREAIAGAAAEASGFRIPLQTLSELVGKFRGSTDRATLAEFVNELARLVDIANKGGGALDKVFGTETRKGVINITDEMTEANKKFQEMAGQLIIIDGKLGVRAFRIPGDELSKAADAAAAAVKKVTEAGNELIKAKSSWIDADLPKRFEDWAKALNELPTKELKVAEATRILGKEMGGKFVDALDTEGLEGARQLFRRWGLDIGSTATETAKAFKEAMDDLKTAKQVFDFVRSAGTVETGIVFTPFLTAVIEEAAKQLGNLTAFLRVNRNEIAQWAADFGRSVVQVAASVLKIMSGIPVAISKAFGGLRESLGGLGGFSGEQITAGFIAAAVAVTGLAIAFKGLAVVMTPITLFFSLFSGFGPILIGLGAVVVAFWDQIKEGVGAAFEEGSSVFTGLRHAIEDLFKGDLIGFWRNFSNAAVLAFEMIVAKFTEMEGAIGDIFRGFQGQKIETPWVAALFEAFKQIKDQLPEIIIGITAVILLFAKFPKFSAFTFGLGFFADGLKALGAIAQIVAAAFTVLGVTFGILAAIVGGQVAAAIVGIGIALGAAATAVWVFWDSIKQAFGAGVAWLAAKIAEAMKLVDDWVAQPVAGAWEWIGQKFSEAVAAVSAKWEELKAQLELFFAPVTDAWAWIKTAWTDIIVWIGGKITEGSQLITNFVTAPIAGAWEWLKNTFDAVVAELAAKWERFKAKFTFGLAGDANAGAPGGATGGQFASGGLLGGRGTGTSDSNLAWVSRGEYITPARAVRQPGVLAFLELLRLSGGDLRKAMAGIRGYAEGGTIGSGGIGSAAIGGARASTLGQVLDAFKELIEATVSALGDVRQSMVSTTQGIVDNLQKMAGEIADMTNAAWQKLGDIQEKLISTTNQIISDATGGTGRVDPSFARGGLLGGRGTGTSDSNLAWLSRGEYVTPAAAVAQPGVFAFLEALRRSGGNLRAVLDGMGRYALGGLVVPGAIPAFAGGGGMHPVTINFAGTTVSGLRASSDVVEELRRAAVLAQVRSGGRKPSRYS